MKRFFSWVLILALVVTMLPVALFAAAEGDAEELPAEAVAIRTVEDLDKIGYEYPLDGYYYLACDIDLTAATSRNGDYYNEGAGWLPIGTQSMPFTGTFDGCGFTITGLNINRPTEEKVGFFGAIKDASIKNVNFVNTNITGKQTVGLVGYALGTSVISNIHSTNSAVTAKVECGGIAGAIATTGGCEDCSHSGTVTGSNCGGILGRGNATSCQNSGSVIFVYTYNWKEFTGIAGIVYSGIATKCTNFATVTTQDRPGNAAGITVKGNCTLCGNYGEVYGCSGSQNSNVSSDGNACGISINGAVDQCFNLGNVHSPNTTPYALSVQSDVKNSFNFGNNLVLTSRNATNCYNANGIISDRYFAPNCFYYAPSASGDGTLASLRQLRLQSTFKDWDFDTVWTMGGNEDYLFPELKEMPVIFTKSLTGIAMATDPIQLEYLEAKDDLDLTGGKITLKYNNDTTERIPITADMISGFDNTKVGKQTVTVTYEGFKTTFEVTVTAKTLLSVALTATPEKLTYLEAKDTLDVTGGKLTLYYNNDTTEEVALTTAMVSGFDNTVIGAQVLTVTYGGMTATYAVEILAKTAARIEVTTPPDKLSYLEAKDALDLSGGEVTVYYDNDTQETLPLTDESITVSGFDAAKPGTQTLTVRRGTLSTTFNITVVAKSVSEISVAAAPDKLSYLEAKDTLDVTGGKLRVRYNNDTEDLIDMTPETVSGFDNTTVGTQTLTVSYAGKTATFQVEIVAKSLSGIAVKDLPAKLAYREWKDTLNVSGGTLVLSYNNGTSELIDMTTEMVSGFDNTKVGTQTLTVTYGGFTATFEVEITAKRLVSISVTTKPEKLAYLEGKDVLDTTGGKLTLYYNNGTRLTLDLTEDMVSGFDNAKVGTQTLTVTYEGLTTTYEISVAAKTLVSIAVAMAPAKVTYNEGEALDVTGGKISATYNNGDVTLLDMTAEMVSGFNSSKGTSAQTLTVTYEGKTATFVIEILHAYTAAVTPPTCTARGYTTWTCTCGDSYKDTYVDKLGHDMVVDAAVPATCTETGLTEGGHCSRCDYKIAQEATPKLGHDMVTDAAVPATCTETGLTEGSHCSRCDYKVAQQTTPKLGHDWGDPVYEWADDHSAITATRVCKRDPDHTETENGVVTSTVTKEATYDAEGEITYTATFANPAFEPQTAVVSLPRLERPAPTPAENPFTDIRESAYYHDPVLWAVANNVTNGTSASTFSPDEGCTRAQVVTFLWRAAGKPDPASSENPFSDVKEGAYYYNAVLWAVEKGITNGTSDKSFSPDETCTRAQIVTFLWRYEEQPAPAGTNNPFADVKPNAYFGSAVLWAVETGITNGTSATTFDPEDTCTRAQVVTFLYRDIVKS